MELGPHHTKKLGWFQIGSDRYGQIDKATYSAFVVFLEHGPCPFVSQGHELGADDADKWG